MEGLVGREGQGDLTCLKELPSTSPFLLTYGFVWVFRMQLIRPK